MGRAFTLSICGPLLALVVAGPAGAAQIAARRYTVEEGLAHNFVGRIYQDSHGYIWFGTREGGFTPEFARVLLRELEAA